MTLPASTVSLTAALEQLAVATSLKQDAQQSLAFLQANPVTSDWVFAFIDRMRNSALALQAIGTVTGINAAATAQIPGYVGTLTDDITTTFNAAAACVTWIVQNFPKDSTGQFILSHQLNADGTRTPRSFPSTSTVGLQTALQALIATIG